jgi:hypothetical protein
MNKYDRVRLCSNSYNDEGAKFGDIGYIIECYDDGMVEVEFSHPENGITFAQIVVSRNELEVC